MPLRQTPCLSTMVAFFKCMSTFTLYYAVQAYAVTILTGFKPVCNKLLDGAVD